MPAVSVIICTHDPRPDYLRRVLDALKAQTLPTEEWELLLIDNASKEPLAAVWGLKWHPDARHIREDELGLTAARLRGIREARSDLIVFLDDDNVARGDYLEVACRLAREHPNLGCYGAGVLEPEFEQEPSPDCLPYIGCLAIRSVPRSIWGSFISDMPLPWGAGLVVRRSVANQYQRAAEACSLRSGLDRKGESLLSGGDDEFAYAASQLGLGVGIFVELIITHLIEKRRVSREYLERLNFGQARSSAILAHLHQQSLDNIAPRLATVLTYVLRGHPARALAALAYWAAFLRKPRIERVFLRARSRGWEMGLRDVSSSKRS